VICISITATVGPRVFDLTLLEEEIKVVVVLGNHS
jgi:hypothetical protein